MIELAFTTIKDINIEFEIGVYFIDPDSKIILKDSTSKDFSSKLIKDSSILAKILFNELNIIYQKDNSNEWNELFRNDHGEGVNVL